MRNSIGAVFVMSVFPILAGLYFIWFWYGPYYSYYCPSAGQCGDIFHSGNTSGLFGIILTVIGLFGILMGFILIFVDKSSRRASHDPSFDSKKLRTMQKQVFGNGVFSMSA